MRMTASYLGETEIDRTSPTSKWVSRPNSGRVRRAPCVADDRRTDVHPVHPVAEARQPHRVQPGAAAGVEDPRRWGREKLGEPADLLIDQRKAPAGAVVTLVEVLGEQAAAEDRIRPVELGVRVERTRPGGETGEAVDGRHG